MLRHLVTAIAAAGICLALFALGWWSTRTQNANTVALRVLDTAYRTNGNADAVASTLPGGARAVVVTPSGVASSTANVVVTTDRPAAVTEQLLADPGAVVASVPGIDGWWVAIALPGPDPLTAAALGLAAAAGGGALGLVAVPRRRPPPAAPAETDGRRDAVVRAVAELLPQVPEALHWQVENALAAGGVHPLVPDGRRVTSDHRVVGVLPTEDAGKADTVARTIRPGYADDRRVVVPPKVVIYVAAEMES